MPMGSGSEPQEGNHFRADPAIATEIENLMRDGGIDKLVRALQGEFGGHQDECPDSVAEAVSRLLLRERVPRLTGSRPGSRAARTRDSEDGVGGARCPPTLQPTIPESGEPA
jgi:hypothetical protein